jgi:hypothetical protein
MDRRPTFCSLGDGCPSPASQVLLAETKYEVSNTYSIWRAVATAALPGCSPLAASLASCILMLVSNLGLYQRGFGAAIFKRGSSGRCEVWTTRSLIDVQTAKAGRTSFCHNRAVER